MDIDSSSLADDPVSDTELLGVIADFLEMGHVENIVAMFRQEHRYYAWTGSLLSDERFAVRLGVSVLFEYLAADVPNHTELALESLAQAMENSRPWVRGEALNVLAIIGGRKAMALIAAAVDDPDPQVREVARDILQSAPDA